jgi:hypothetical protein
LKNSPEQNHQPHAPSRTHRTPFSFFFFFLIFSFIVKEHEKSAAGPLLPARPIWSVGGCAGSFWSAANGRCLLSDSLVQSSDFFLLTANAVCWANRQLALTSTRKEEWLITFWPLSRRFHFIDTINGHGNDPVDTDS